MTNTKPASAKISGHERVAVERRITSIQAELKVLQNRRLTRVEMANQWQRLLDELVDLQAVIRQETTS